MAEDTRFSAEPGSIFIPFWERLPRFLLYPLQLGSVMRIAGYSALGGISSLLPEPFSNIVYFLLWIVFLKYAFLVMEHTAKGHFDEPADITGTKEGDTAQVMRQYGLLIILGMILGALTTTLGMFGYALGVIMLNVLLPAGIMIIAVTNSFWQALNPAKTVFYIRTIGSPYLALCFLLLTVSASGGWVMDFLAEHMDSSLAWPTFTFVEFYFALVGYHMMGYVIYQYHEKLGVRADVSFEEAMAKIAPEKVVNPVLTKLTTLIAEGNEKEALSLLREELRLNWDNNDLHERYQRLLVAAGKESSVLIHGQEFINKLVNEKHISRALELYEQCLKLDPEFQLQDPHHVIALAEAAKAGNRHDLALTLMRRFDKRNPGHPHIPLVYLLSAKILSEHFRKDKEAIQILQALQAKFPDHLVAAETRQYLDILQKSAGAG